MVEAAIDALRAVWHRGAVDADGKTGDGAGIYLEIPQDFLREQIRGGKQADGRIAVGMVFLPRTDFAGQERCRTIVETEVLGFGYSILGWRQVPVDTSVIGDKAIATRPEIEQIMLGNPKGVHDDEFERELFLIRRRIENQVLAEHINGFYICSLSCRSVIYKGLFLAEQLSVFYPDLQDERFVSSFAVFHQRYSTNTWPSWPLAQPFRDARPQRRDQHAARQSELDEEPRDADGRAGVRRLQRGRQADHPGRQLRQRGARCRGRGAGPRRPLAAAHQDPADPAGLGQEDGDPAGAQGSVQLLQLRHGAVGRPGRRSSPATAAG